VEAGTISQAELDEHVHRILRSMFAAGVIDFPRQRGVIDPFAGLDVARKIEEGGIVLLKNKAATLAAVPIRLHTIAVIGAHSDVGMISGGGSAQVDPPGGNAISKPGKGATHWQEEIWFPTSPLKAIQARAPKATVKYDSGDDPATAAALAKTADVAIVFAYQWESEGMDLPTLSLAHNQDALIAAVAAANPHTVVVIESGSPVLMPWVDAPAAIVEAWYAGSMARMLSATCSSVPSTHRASCPTRSRRARRICLTPPSPSRRPCRTTSMAPLLRPSSGPRAFRRFRLPMTKASRLVTSGMTRRTSRSCFHLAMVSRIRLTATRA
jgi:hypothetical protein